jgi:hypothetical protein
VAHLLGWMRAVVRELRRVRIASAPPLGAPVWEVVLARRPAARGRRSRAPPAFA